MRAFRIVTWASALLLVISIACVPVAEAAAFASHSVSLARPNPVVVPWDFLQQLPRIEWRKEIRSPNKQHDGAEFYFLPHVEPEPLNEDPQGPGSWC